jgi:DNA-binding LacI/PurR family transcriptional regulator
LNSLAERPTAILCSNDMTAIGVMRAAYEYGVPIPRDLSVVGFDDVRLAEFTTPPLTTVQMSQKLLAEYAFRALRTEVEVRTSPGEAGHEYELTTNLVLRGSTALAPAESVAAKAVRGGASRGRERAAERE